MDEKVAVIGFLRFPPESVAAIQSHLATFVEATRSADGCIAYDVAEDLYEPGLIRFSELWPSKSALDAHLVAEHIAPWRHAAKEHGLLERKFVAYEISASRNV